MNKKGVTLIELIVVMVIIGIAAVLLAPNIGAWLPNYRLRSTARDIVSTMRTAQMRAVSTNLTYRVSFTVQTPGPPPTPATYTLQYENPPAGSGNWVTEGVTQTLPTGISISAITFTGNNAVFNSNSTASSGSVTLRNTRGTERQLTVNPSTSRVTIQ